MAVKMENVREYIQSFSELEIGWDFGEGGPISQETIDRALELVDEKSTYSAYPNADLSLGLCYLHPDSCDDFLIIRVLPDGFYELDYEKGFGPEYEVLMYNKSLSKDSVLLYIHNFKINIDCFRSYIQLKWVKGIIRRNTCEKK